MTSIGKRRKKKEATVNAYLIKNSKGEGRKVVVGGLG